MNERLVDDVTIRDFEPQRDEAVVGVMVGEVWSGGNDDLMEEQFGVVGDRPWQEWMAESVLAYLKAEGARSFVAEKDGEVVGFCSYVVDEGRGLGTVGYNGVARKWQGRGIGSAMLGFVLERIKGEGMEYGAVIVADNEQHGPARHNYEKHGFR